MSIEIKWDSDAHTTILWTFEGRWTWQDFTVAQQELGKLLDSVEHTVAVIADMTRAPALPPDTFTFFKRAERSARSNRGRVVMVGANMFIRNMARTFNQVFRSRKTHFEFADSVEEARALLAQPGPVWR